MIITNKTNVNIYFGNNCLKPNETKKRYEKNYDTFGIHSDIGSVEIITERNKRKINNYGKLIGKEGNEIELGMGTRNIIIECLK